MDIQTFDSFKPGDKITSGQLFPGLDSEGDSIDWKAIDVTDYPNGNRMIEFRLQWRGVNLASIEAERVKKQIQWRSSK